MIQLTKSNRALDPQIIDQASTAFEALRNRTDLGFLQLPGREDNWSCSHKRYSEIADLYERYIFVGIGGSGLGGKTLSHAMQYGFPTERVDFLENIDQHTIEKCLASIKNLKKTHWVFISKSGSTLETLAIANQVNDFLQAEAIKLHEHCTVISELKESPLTKWASANSVAVLGIDIDVGGRFSVLSPVGLFPAACLGVPLEQVRSGARWALDQKQLVSQLAAHSLSSFSRQEWITQFWFYCDGLKVFSEWLQQLWAESLAKRTDNSGNPAARVSSPIGCVGAIDQHSVLQQVMEGSRDKMIWLSRLQSVELESKAVTNMFSDFTYLDGKNVAQVMSAEATATYSAFAEENVSVLELVWRDLSPETIGASFMLFELIVGTVGEALNINAYNQPGVELGKKLAKQILSSN